MREDLENSKMLELATATGFLVNGPDGNYLVTNWHAVTGYSSSGQSLGSSAAPPTHVDVDFHNPDDIAKPAVHRYPLYEESGVPRWRVHPDAGNMVDVVALQVGFGGSWSMNPGVAVQVQGYDINDQFELRIEPSTDVSVVGFPYGRRSAGSLGIWVRGTVASEPGFDFESEPVFLIDCRARRGQSGSPVIAYRSAGSIVHGADGTSRVMGGAVWQLLGVYSGRISEESDIGKVWKLSVVREVVEHGTCDSFEFF